MLPLKVAGYLKEIWNMKQGDFMVQTFIVSVILYYGTFMQLWVYVWFVVVGQRIFLVCISGGGVLKTLFKNIWSVFTSSIYIVVLWFNDSKGSYNVWEFIKFIWLKGLNMCAWGKSQPTYQTYQRTNIDTEVEPLWDYNMLILGLIARHESLWS